VNEQERQQYLQSVREGKVSLTGVEASIFKDLDEATKLYQDKQQRLETLNSLANTLRTDIVALGGQIVALSRTLCQAEESRRVAANPPISLEEFGKKIGAEKVEFIPNR
jgi:hypothetical protein